MARNTLIAMLTRTVSPLASKHIYDSLSSTRHLSSNMLHVLKNEETRKRDFLLARYASLPPQPATAAREGSLLCVFDGAGFGSGSGVPRITVVPAISTGDTCQLRQNTEGEEEDQLHHLFMYQK